MNESRTIVVLNAVLSNGGDAAILRGLERALRAASPSELRFVVFDSDPAATAARFPDLDIRSSLSSLLWPAAAGLGARLRRRLGYRRRVRGSVRAAAALRTGDDAARQTTPDLLAALQTLAHADAVVSTGGTYLTSTYWLGPRLAAFEAVGALDRPFALYTQSLGPFHRPDERRALAEVFGSARLTLLRDHRSLAEVLALAPDAHAVERADAAFGLANPAALRAAPGRSMPERSQVVISVREWPYFERESAAIGMARYRDAVGAAAAHAVRSLSAHVTFLSTCQGTPGYRYDDADIARQIQAALPDDVRARTTVRGEALTPDALLSAFGAADLVIATRMHAAILALAGGTPVVPIAYERKTTDLFAALGVSGWVADIETITAESFPTLLDRVVHELPSARADLFAQVERMRGDALAAGQDVATALGLA